MKLQYFIIGLGNGLAPDWCQAITYTNDVKIIGAVTHHKRTMYYTPKSIHLKIISFWFAFRGYPAKRALPTLRHPPCWRMADRALLAGYPRFLCVHWGPVDIVSALVQVISCHQPGDKGITWTNAEPGPQSFLHFYTKSPWETVMMELRNLMLYHSMAHYD